MKRRLSIVFILSAGLLSWAAAGCSSGGDASTSAGKATSPAAQTSASRAAGASSSCSGGLTGTEPGVVSITCNGPADIKIDAGGATKDMRGGRCQSGGGVWSATVGVIIDKTGVNGKYTGPVVDNVTVNNTDNPGKATVQASLGGKLYYDLGNAKLTLSADQKTAHIVGVSDKNSDVPSAPITIDVNC